ncbi:MAG: hypothetical protein RL701_3031 [Pseudomonadota bacterium]
MKKAAANAWRRVLQTVSLTVGCVSGFSACDQPSPKCNVAHGAFAAKYTLESGEGACAELHGEVLYLQSYYAQRSRQDNRPDLDKTSIAIAPGSIVDALAGAGDIQPGVEDVPYALGVFTTKEPDDNTDCIAPRLTAATLHLGPLPAADECTEAPTYNLRYEFSHVRVRYSASEIGTRFYADLSYTDGDCTAKYRVTALYPAVACGQDPEEPPAEEPTEAVSDDDAGTPDPGAECPPSEPAPAAPVDETKCKDPNINPDYAVVCDPDVLMCVLKK